MTHSADTHAPRSSTRVAARLAAVATATVVAAAGLGLGAVGPASASTVNGIATIAPPGLTTPLTSGASTTPFTVALPAQAACDGDTATHGYHVYSYLVQKGVNLAAVTFNNFPSAGFGLVDNTGTYYGPVNTAINTGQIVGIPNNFQWAPLITGGGVSLSQLLYSGSAPTSTGIWEVGLVCANAQGVEVDNWNIEITFTYSTTDPNSFVWAAVPTGSAAPLFTSASTASFTSGSAGTFTPVATGTPTPAITESGALPTGVSFTGGTLTGTPTVTGSFPITFSASNGVGPAVTQSFTLTVAAATSSTTTTTTAPGATTTATTAADSSTTTTTVAVPATASSSSGGDTGATSSGTGSSGTTSGSSLAFTGFHTLKGLGLGLLGVGLGFVLLGWGYRKKIRPSRDTMP
jgi:hypothetical protein